MRAVTVALLSMAICGCASRPSSVATPPTLPRAKPVQAMAVCRTQTVTDACKFRPEFRKLELGDQVAMIANCIEVTAAVLWECDEKQKRLAEWVASEP